jgi:hypothetical protein
MLEFPLFEIIHPAALLRLDSLRLWLSLSAICSLPRVKPGTARMLQKAFLTCTCDEKLNLAHRLRVENEKCDTM